MLNFLNILCVLCFSLHVQEKNLLAEKFHLSFIANIIGLLYFVVLGCGSLFYNINQGHRQTLY